MTHRMGNKSFMGEGAGEVGEGAREEPSDGVATRVGDVSPKLLLIFLKVR